MSFLSINVFFVTQESKSIPQLVKILTKIHFAEKICLYFYISGKISHAYLIPLVLIFCDVSEEQKSHLGVN